MAKQVEGDAQNGGPINEDANPYGGGRLNPDAPLKSQPSTIRDANDDEKPDPTSIVQVEELESSE